MRIAVRIDEAGLNVVAVIIVPNHDVAAVSQSGDIGLVEVSCTGDVDLRADRAADAVIEPRDDDLETMIFIDPAANSK